MDLEARIHEFLTTLDNTEDIEWYASDQDVGRSILLEGSYTDRFDSFLGWMRKHHPGELNQGGSDERR